MPRYEPPLESGGGVSYPPQPPSYRDPAPRHDQGFPYPVAPAVDPAAADPMWDPADSGTPAWAAGDPRRGRAGVGPRRLLIVLGVVLLICGAASFTGYLLVRDEPASVADPPPPDPTSAAPTPQVTGAAPLPQSSTDVRFVVVGQCVRNEGGNDDPKLTITPCGPRTYEVLKRFDGFTTGKDDARSKCSAVAGYTDWYFFDSPLDVLDYVLCLKSR